LQLYKRMLEGFKILEYQDKLYRIRKRIEVSRISDPNKLKKQYNADLVLKNYNYYWILEKIIEAEFEDKT